jgi:hypothetical protein
VLGGSELQLPHTDEPVQGGSRTGLVASGGELLLVGQVEDGGDALAHRSVII